MTHPDKINKNYLYAVTELNFCLQVDDVEPGVARSRLQRIYRDTDRGTSELESVELVEFTKVIVYLYHSVTTFNLVNEILCKLKRRSSLTVRVTLTSRRV